MPYQYDVSWERTSPLSKWSRSNLHFQHLYACMILCPDCILLMHRSILKLCGTSLAYLDDMSLERTTQLSVILLLGFAKVWKMLENERPSWKVLEKQNLSWKFLETGQISFKVLELGFLIYIHCKKLKSPEENQEAKMWVSCGKEHLGHCHCLVTDLILFIYFYFATS